MAKYVLQHGGLSLGSGAATPGTPLMPSADPLKPTIVEMDEAEAAKINFSPGLLLEGSKGKPPALVLLSDYELVNKAELAKAKVLSDAKPKDEKHPKGGGK